MKKIVLSILFLFVFIITALQAQNYNNFLNYALDATPTHGVKIKTNIPFKNRDLMPYIKIEGYNYRNENLPRNPEILNLSLAWYIHDDKFYRPVISSYGESIPEVWLGVENGYVIIFLNQKIYFQRFTVSAYANGPSIKQTSYFDNWKIMDEPFDFSNDKSHKLIYKNVFGDNVGIGTETPLSKLDVRGKILADEVEIKVLPRGADFVFAEDYNLPSLSEVEAHIKEHKHLPEIPSEKQMQENGLNMSDFQIKLLQKIEELTLYTIQQEKRIQSLENQLKSKE